MPVDGLSKIYIKKAIASCDGPGHGNIDSTILFFDVLFVSFLGLPVFLQPRLLVLL